MANMKKAIFLGKEKIHSKKQNKDFTKIDLFTPCFEDSKGFKRGGVTTFFIDNDSKLGDTLRLGSIVRPVVEHDPYSGRDELSDLLLIKDTPYDLVALKKD